MGLLRLALACLVGLAWLMSAGSIAAHPVQQSVSADAFWNQLDQTIDWLDKHPSPSSGEWKDQAARWEKIREVTLPGQQTVPVDTSYIVYLMRADPPERAKLSDYLSALKQARLLSTQPGGEREAQLLAEVLARPEFKKDSGLNNAIDQLMQWLLDAYSRLIDMIFGNRNASITIPPEIAIPVTVLVIAVILALVFRDTLRNLFSEVELADEAPGEGEILSARLAGQKAQELSAGGDYRHALRYLYLSALLLLDERGLLRYNRSQTNREYLRQVSSRPDLSDHFKVVVETFDRVWYGFQPVDAANYAEYAQHVSDLEKSKE